MKKYAKSYLIIWAILFAVYNAIVFLIVPNTLEVEGVVLEKFGGAFWSAYIAIVVAFIGNLACSMYFFKTSDCKEKAFLNMPVFRIGWGALIVTMIVGTLTMLAVDLPNWIGAFICIIILAFYAIAVVKASAAAEAVAEIGGKVKEKTSAMKLMIADAEIAMKNAENEEVRAEAKKVYEALKFSDPMSNDALAPVENQIAGKLAEFAATDDIEKAKALSNEIQKLTADRAVKCKVLK